MDDMISRQAAIDALGNIDCSDGVGFSALKYDAINDAVTAIKALPSAQLAQDLTNGCTDTISRQAAIGKVKKLCEGCYLSEHCGKCLAKCLVRKAVKILEKVSSAQPGWIPVTERLPKPNEYENDVRTYYLVQNEYGDMMVCSWQGGFWTQMYRNTHVEDKVVAWMPLPTPYREGGQS